ncbi:transcriptional regulator [Schaalia sp. ZJ1691]|uniref:helix-turn-helix transcriptional regulator n=1 Tax=Schaalia sp. ZJ1691 TaxID=2709404 RepID=UPI0013ECCC7A|nr:transcriptional regulator [Schaalia sp. ZJ1691]
MTTRFLSLHGVANYLGRAYSTLRTYQRDGRLPDPDAIIGQGRSETYGWLPETIDAWNAARPGHGGRPKKQRE